MFGINKARLTLKGNEAITKKLFISINKLFF